MTTTTTKGRTKKAPLTKKTTTESAPESTTATVGVSSAATGSLSVSMASVPDISVHDAYVGRSFNGRSEFDIFDAALKHNWNVLIEGPTGPGKTMAARAYSAKRKKRFYSIASNVGIEPSQLFGKYIPDGDGGFAWIDGPVTDLVRHGGVLLINEVNFMPERVATVIFGLLDGRREITLLDHKGETIKAHEDLFIIADMNPGYAGTRPLNEAFRNRFSIQLFWDYDAVVEQKLIKSDSLRTLMVGIRRQVASGLYVTPVSTNMGMEFEAVAKSLGLDFATENFVNHFQEDERESITKLFEANYERLKKDIEARPLTEEEKTKQRYQMKPGDVDPEWGVFGTDWVWDDDEDEDDGTVEAEEV